MKNKLLLVLLLVVPFLFLNSNPSMAAPTGDDPGAVTYTYEAGNPPPEVIALRDARAGSPTDSSMQGTGWQPQFKGHFNWAVKSTGVETQAAAAYGNTYQWVHMPIPYPVHILNALLKVSLVEFCATADHPTRTMPTKIEIWGYSAGAHVKLYSGSISWINSTNIVCHTVTFGVPAAYESLGVSVLIKYANTTDMIQLNHAWGRFEP